MDEALSKRLIHNYITQFNGGVYSYPELEHLVKILDYVEKNKEQKKYKVALLFICLGADYWQYAKDAIEGAKKYLLPDHQVDFFLWSDIPKASDVETFTSAGVQIMQNRLGRMGIEKPTEEQLNAAKYDAEVAVNGGIDSAKLVEGAKDITVFPTEFQPWPMPTLMRYNLFLQQEEAFRDYDFIFYSDIDMKYVNVVGDEILPTTGGLTAALHPMYAVRNNLWPPYEPNPESAAYVKRPGKVIMEAGKPRFMPMYYAGGFQGGASKDFLEACRGMRKNIDDDFNFRNYVAIWNDESHWNKWLADHEPAIVLTPSYIYPDSLIEEYYKPIWGVDYPPKIVTLTKKHTLEKLGKEHFDKMAEIKKIA